MWGCEGKGAGHDVTITALPEEDGGRFAATVPALPGCLSDGDTPEEAEAAENVRDAIAAWLETWRAEKAEGRR